ncbi:MAG: hypothetical protein HOB52_04275 [Euryarchaeota archaeon]|nr:hypothetical protein [Euryarchaeota archaeon]
MGRIVTEDQPHEEAANITKIIGIGSILVFIISIVLIFGYDGQTSAGPMAVTDGCSIGGIGLVASCALFSIALLLDWMASNSLPNKQNRVQMIPPEITDKD